MIVPLKKIQNCNQNKINDNSEISFSNFFYVRKIYFHLMFYSFKERKFINKNSFLFII